MSKLLDREGVFQAVPINWGIQKTESSQSVALVIEFGITAQMEDGDWTDWSGYEDHSVTGYFYIIKKDGGINTTQVDALAKALGWDGSLRNIEAGPPHVICQITAAFEEYNGKTRLKVQWINHKDYTPGPKTAPPGVVADLESQFGSRLRAAAAAAKKDAPATKPAPPPAPSPGLVPPPAPADGDPGADDKDDLPF